MGRVAELRRRPSALAALRVLTVQRCAAAFLALLSYAAFLWLVYAVWLRDAAAADERRPSTLPVDYEAHLTSERARAARRTADGERETNSAWYRAATGDVVAYGADGDDGDFAGYQTDAAQDAVARAERGLDDSVALTEDQDSLPDTSDADTEATSADYSAGVDVDETTERPLNRRLLVFSSVPQTGSEVITLLLRWLARQNGFEYVPLQTASDRPLEPAEQELLVEKISSLSNSSNDSVCVSHSSYVVDFSQYDAAVPLQFSMIRDPIDRVMSRFTHDRLLGGFSPPPAADPATWTLTLEDCLRVGGEECTFLNGHQYPGLVVPFFCGHHQECTRHNSRWALERAKRTVESRFVTVGVLEDMNTTLAVAETLLPRFFSGVWDRFFVDLVDQIGDSMNTRSQEELSDVARDRLRANLTTEYEFYDFVRQRMEQQYSAFVPGS